MLLISFYPWFPLAAICFLSTCSTSVWYLDLYQEIVFSVLTQKCVTRQKYSMYTYAYVGSLANRVFLGCPATKKIEDTREVTTVMRNIIFLTPLCCNSPQEPNHLILYNVLRSSVFALQQRNPQLESDAPCYAAVLSVPRCSPKVCSTTQVKLCSMDIASHGIQGNTD